MNKKKVTADNVWKWYRDDMRPKILETFIGALNYRIPKFRLHENWSSEILKQFVLVVMGDASLSYKHKGKLVTVSGSYTGVRKRQVEDDHKRSKAIKRAYAKVSGQCDPTFIKNLIGPLLLEKINWGRGTPEELIQDISENDFLLDGLKALLENKAKFTYNSDLDYKNRIIVPVQEITDSKVIEDLLINDHQQSKSAVRAVNDFLKQAKQSKTSVDAVEILPILKRNFSFGQIWFDTDQEIGDCNLNTISYLFEKKEHIKEGSSYYFIVSKYVVILYLDRGWKATFAPFRGFIFRRGATLIRRVHKHK